MMRQSNVQTPRPSLRARSRETLIVSVPKRSDANSSDAKPQKIVAKCLSSDFSAVSDELSPDPSETKSVVEDPSESTTISPSLAPSDAEESGIHESGDRDEEVADSDATEELKKTGEDAAADPTAIIRLQRALMEIGRSPVEIRRSKKLLETLAEIGRSEDVSRGSRKLLDALADISLRDSCAGSWKRSGPSDPIFWAKVRMATLCFLILSVAILNAFIASKKQKPNRTFDPSNFLQPSDRATTWALKRRASRSPNL